MPPTNWHPPSPCAAVKGKGAEEQREPSQLDLLLARLPGCVSKELADELAVNFCYQQTKGARKRLARALAAELPVGALALLPYYARITATLAQVFPDIAQGGCAGSGGGAGGGGARTGGTFMRVCAGSRVFQRFASLRAQGAAEALQASPFLPRAQPSPTCRASGGPQTSSVPSSAPPTCRHPACAAVVAYLEGEFATLARSKDATARTLEPRVRNMRYVAELAKFRLFPPGAAFSMLKSLLDDFAGHNIDAACAMVETAGRFFFRQGAGGGAEARPGQLGAAGPGLRLLQSAGQEHPGRHNL